MAFAPSSPVTGATITGLTSPTYTLVSDTPPSATSKQFAVSAIGGTQTGVIAHSLSSPFTHTMFRPANYKVLGQPSPNGVVRSFPRNVFEVLTRKGLGVLLNQPIQTGMCRTSFSLPAGSDTYDINSVRAMISAHIGLLWQISNGLSETVNTGTL